MHWQKLKAISQGRSYYLPQIEDFNIGVRGKYQNEPNNQSRWNYQFLVRIRI